MAALFTVLLAGTAELAGQDGTCLRALPRGDGPTTLTGPTSPASSPSTVVHRSIWWWEGGLQRAGAGPLWVSPTGRLCGDLERSLEAVAPHQAVGQVVLAPGRAFLYSLVVPGLSQRALGQQRWVAYLALEAWAWVQLFSYRSEGKDLQGSYRDLAWNVARRISQGPRTEGPFEYYEALTKYNASGAYDRDPSRPGTQPETDSTTFNGSVWKLAREIFLPSGSDPPDEESPEYQRALEYYLQRSYDPRFAWVWGENTLQQARYSELIEESDENLRRSTTLVGVLIANHLLSAFDGFVSARLRQASLEVEEVVLEAFMADLRGALGLRVRVRP